MVDYLGYRAKMGVTTPSTNTVVQPEYDDMRPPGVTNHLGRMHIENIDTEKLEEAHASFLAQLGGSVSKGRKKKDEEKEALEKARTPKTKSHLETKQFFERELSIPDIAEIRDLTEATIWKHLSYIIEDDPEFDITYLQPDTEIIEAVEKAVLAITKRGNDDDLNQNGEVKLKPIYEELNEAVDYEDIKKALLFLE